MKDLNAKEDSITQRVVDLVYALTQEDPSYLWTCTHYGLMRTERAAPAADQLANLTPELHTKVTLELTEVRGDTIHTAELRIQLRGREP